jgi:hypothetical protein
MLVATQNVPTKLIAQTSSIAEHKTGVLASPELESIVPSAVFFKGRSATVQIRNSGAVRFSDGSILFAALVDTSGYSTSVRDKYQFYLVTETPVEIAGKKLGVGAYGGGFLEGGGFVVMDISGQDVLTGKTVRDDQMKRPRPLQIVAGGTPGEYRLELGRQYVSFKALGR